MQRDRTLEKDATPVGTPRVAAGTLRLKEDGLLKAAQGVTTIEEVLRTVV